MQRVLSTRGGTIAVGVFAAIVAGIAVLVYLGQYRDSVHQESQSVDVLVARQLIPQGTPGEQIGSQHLFQVTSMRKSQLKGGAVTDPAALKGRVATEDLFPGQQLTLSDFSSKPTNAVKYKLAGDQRAISVPLDAAHGLLGYVQTGDHVDVEASFLVQGADGKNHPILRTIMHDIPVLYAPPSAGKVGIGAGANSTQNMVLKMTDAQAADLAFSSDNGKVWIIERPQSGAKPTRPSLVTLETLLFGIKPVSIERVYRASWGH
jgi:Flp pilus assembly protein CpaB